MTSTKAISIYFKNLSFNHLPVTSILSQDITVPRNYALNRGLVFITINWILKYLTKQIDSTKLIVQKKNTYFLP